MDETSKDLKIRIRSFSAKLDALCLALTPEQKDVYLQSLLDSKNKLRESLGELSPEQAELLDKLFS